MAEVSRAARGSLRGAYGNVCRNDYWAWEVLRNRVGLSALVQIDGRGDQLCTERDWSCGIVWRRAVRQGAVDSELDGAPRCARGSLGAQWRSEPAMDCGWSAVMQWLQLPALLLWVARTSGVHLERSPVAVARRTNRAVQVSVGALGYPIARRSNAYCGARKKRAWRYLGASGATARACAATCRMLGHNPHASSNLMGKVARNSDLVAAGVLSARTR